MFSFPSITSTEKQRLHGSNANDRYTHTHTHTNTHTHPPHTHTNTKYPMREKLSFCRNKHRIWHELDLGSNHDFIDSLFSLVQSSASLTLRSNSYLLHTVVLKIKGNSG